MRRFALEFGDEGHRQGFCLYKIGCKGPETYANCPSIGFGDVGFGSWPVGTGHPCFGCTEKEIGFRKPLHALATVKTLTPPTAFPQVDADKGQGISAGAAAAVGVVGGIVVGAGAMLLKQMGEDNKSAADSTKERT